MLSFSFYKIKVGCNFFSKKRPFRSFSSKIHSSSKLIALHLESLEGFSWSLDKREFLYKKYGLVYLGHISELKGLQNYSRLDFSWGSGVRAKDKGLSSKVLKNKKINYIKSSDYNFFCQYLLDVNTSSDLLAVRRRVVSELDRSRLEKEGLLEKKKLREKHSKSDKERREKGFQTEVNLMMEKEILKQRKEVYKLVDSLYDSKLNKGSDSSRKEGVESEGSDMLKDLVYSNIVSESSKDNGVFFNVFSQFSVLVYMDTLLQATSNANYRDFTDHTDPDELSRREDTSEISGVSLGSISSYDRHTLNFDFTSSERRRLLYQEVSDSLDLEDILFLSPRVFYGFKYTFFFHVERVQSLGESFRDIVKDLGGISNFSNLEVNSFSCLKDFYTFLNFSMRSDLVDNFSDCFTFDWLPFFSELEGSFYSSINLYDPALKQSWFKKVFTYSNPLNSFYKSFQLFSINNFSKDYVFNHQEESFIFLENKELKKWFFSGLDTSNNMVDALPSFYNYFENTYVSEEISGNQNKLKLLLVDGMGSSDKFLLRYRAFNEVSSNSLKGSFLRVNKSYFLRSFNGLMKGMDLTRVDNRRLNLLEDFLTVDYREAGFVESFYNPEFTNTPFKAFWMYLKFNGYVGRFVKLLGKSYGFKLGSGLGYATEMSPDVFFYCQKNKRVAKELSYRESILFLINFWCDNLRLYSYVPERSNVYNLEYSLKDEVVFGMKKNVYNLIKEYYNEIVSIFEVQVLSRFSFRKKERSVSAGFLKKGKVSVGFKDLFLKSADKFMLGLDSFFNRVLFFEKRVERGVVPVKKSLNSFFINSVNPVVFFFNSIKLSFNLIRVNTSMFSYKFSFYLKQTLLYRILNSLFLSMFMLVKLMVLFVSCYFFLESAYLPIAFTCSLWDYIDGVIWVNNDLLFSLCMDEINVSNMVRPTANALGRNFVEEMPIRTFMRTKKWRDLMRVYKHEPASYLPLVQSTNGSPLPFFLQKFMFGSYIRRGISNRSLATNTMAAYNEWYKRQFLKHKMKLARKRTNPLVSGPKRAAALKKLYPLPEDNAHQWRLPKGYHHRGMLITNHFWMNTAYTRVFAGQSLYHWFITLRLARTHRDSFDSLGAYVISDKSRNHNLLSNMFMWENISYIRFFTKWHARTWMIPARKAIRRNVGKYYFKHSYKKRLIANSTHFTYQKFIWWRTYFNHENGSRNRNLPLGRILSENPLWAKDDSFRVHGRVCKSRHNFNVMYPKPKARLKMVDIYKSAGFKRLKTLEEKRAFVRKKMAKHGLTDSKKQSVLLLLIKSSRYDYHKRARVPYRFDRMYYVGGRELLSTPPKGNMEWHYGPNIEFLYSLVVPAVLLFRRFVYRYKLMKRGTHIELSCQNCDYFSLSSYNNFYVFFTFVDSFGWGVSRGHVRSRLLDDVLYAEMYGIYFTPAEVIDPTSLANIIKTYYDHQSYDSLTQSFSLGNLDLSVFNVFDFNTMKSGESFGQISYSPFFKDSTSGSYRVYKASNLKHLRMMRFKFVFYKNNDLIPKN